MHIILILAYIFHFVLPDPIQTINPAILYTLQLLLSYMRHFLMLKQNMSFYNVKLYIRGKTFLSNCLGKAACRDGITTRYIRIPDLFVQLEEAELKRGRNKLINKYAKCPLLILDEWLINSMNEQEIEFIFELVERRYQNKSTIFCTQFKIESWHTRLGGGVHADAIMDRIIHNSITINAGDVNMREVTSNMNRE